jgi:hypothetical protein
VSPQWAPYDADVDRRDMEEKKVQPNPMSCCTCLLIKEDSSQFTQDHLS